MPDKKVQLERNSITDWQQKCPSCDRTLAYQPIFTAEIRDPFFKCRFCDAKGTAIWDNSGRNRLVRS